VSFIGDALVSVFRVILQETGGNLTDFRVTLILEGLARDNGHVRLKEFAREIERLGSALYAAEGTAPADSGARAVYYRVVDLSHKSPASVTFEGVPNDPRVDPRALVLDSLFGLADRVNGGGDVGEADLGLLRSFRDLAAPVGKRLRAARIISGERELDLTEPFRKRLADLLDPTTEAPGFLSGLLESINIHNWSKTFRIYPDIGPRQADCVFPAALLPEAVAAIGEFVRVRGILRYRANEHFPHEIRVDRIERTEGEVPSVVGLRGAFPDLGARREAASDLE
jgi:hypothetical protein